MSDSRPTGDGAVAAARAPGSREAQNQRICFACVVALTALLACPIITGETYTGNDLRDFHIPVRQFYAKCLETGDNFTWMPGIYCGFYIHGEGQAGMYHPLHWALYRFLPLDTALTLEMVFGVPVMFAGMYVLLRRWRLRRDASALGALLLAFSGFNARHFVHVNALSVMAHVPWLLVAIDCTLGCRGRARSTAAACLALLTGSQILMGYPQYVWFSLLAESACVLAVVRGGAPGGRILLALAAKILGLGVGAVQFIPTVDAWSGSARVAMTEQARGVFGMTWPALSQTVAPYLLGPKAILSSPQEYGIYAGAVVPGLLLWLVLRVRRFGEHRRLAVMSIVLTLVAIDLSFGDGGLLGSFVSRIPPASFFRAPVRYFGLCQIGIAIAAAIALHDLAERAESGNKPGTAGAVAFLAPAVLAVVVVWLAGWSPAAPQGPPVDAPTTGSAVAAMAGPVLCVLAGLLLFACVKSKRWGIAGLLVFASADLGIYGGMYVRSASVSSVAALAESLPEVPATDGRISSPLTASNLWLLEGRSMVEGYAALVPRKALDYGQPQALRVAGAHWANIGDQTRPEDSSPLDWQEIADPAPRARMVSSVNVCPYIHSGISLAGIDVSSMAVLSEDIQVDPGPPGMVTVKRDDPGRAVFSTDARGRQVLVFSESWHSGWRARIDGAPVRVLKAYGDFMAVPVEPGLHTVEFEFAPVSLRAGAWVTCLSVVAVLATGVWTFSRREKPAKDGSAGPAL